MTRELNAFGPDEDVHAGAVKRSAEGIRMESLAPLVERFLMTMPAVFCVGKGSRLNKVVAFHRRIAGYRRPVGAKAVVVGSTNFVGVFFARRILIGGGLDGGLCKTKGCGDDRDNEKPTQE